VHPRHRDPPRSGHGDCDHADDRHPEHTSAVSSVGEKEDDETRRQEWCRAEVTHRRESGEHTGRDRKPRLLTCEKQIGLVKREDRKEKAERPGEASAHDEPDEASWHERERGERGNDGSPVAEDWSREQ
jgi:hypothetical protein